MPKNWNITLGGVGFQLLCGKLCCKPDGREMKATVALQGSLLMKIYRKEKVLLNTSEHWENIGPTQYDEDLIVLQESTLPQVSCLPGQMTLQMSGFL